MKVQAVTGIIDSNVFIVEQDSSTIVIDAGAPLSKIQKVLKGKKVDAILITHKHFDHVWFLKIYKKTFGCPVISPKDENEITVGQFKIKPLLCPGHSADSVVYLIEDNLFTGDVLFSNTIGRTDLMRGGPTHMQASLHKLLEVKFKIAYHGHYASSTYIEQQKNIKRFL